MASPEPLNISLIAAVATNGVIGQGGAMPWRLSTDMRRFKAITMGKPVIMGRKTFESIGRPLPGRVNIVATAHGMRQVGDVVFVRTLDTAMTAAIAAAAASDVVEAMVIGGGEIYAAMMPRAARLYITHVALEPEGDTTFPPIDPAIWQPVSSEEVPAGANDSAASRFVVYERRRA